MDKFAVWNKGLNFSPVCEYGKYSLPENHLNLVQTNYFNIGQSCDWKHECANLYV